jgi:hypothetical protein
VYHEHLSYFLARSFAAATRGSGFRIDAALRTEIHGGSVRFILRKKGAAGEGAYGPSFERLLEEEQARGFHSVAMYRALAERVEKTRADLTAALGELASAGVRCVGYGASAKGNTLLNAFALDLEYIVDDNPLKWGMLTPGRNIPITAPDRLAEDRLAEEPGRLAILVLAWNFYEEVRRRLRALRGGRGDECLRYIPVVCRERLDANSGADEGVASEARPHSRCRRSGKTGVQVGCTCKEGGGPGCQRSR